MVTAAMGTFLFGGAGATRVIVAAIIAAAAAATSSLFERVDLPLEVVDLVGERLVGFGQLTVGVGQDKVGFDQLVEGGTFGLGSIGQVVEACLEVSESEGLAVLVVPPLPVPLRPALPDFCWAAVLASIAAFTLVPPNELAPPAAFGQMWDFPCVAL